MTFSLEPIGYVRTRFVDRAHTPRQPGAWARGVPATIELNPGFDFEQALADLAGIERIWVITFFDRNQGRWRPRVLPPRGPHVRRGVFATRSPHRPNPIGLSLVTLRAVHGRVLEVADADLLDATPVLDIKPYLPAIEAFPASRAGWIDALDAAPRFAIVWDAPAAAQAAWLADAHGIEVRDVAERVLADDPTPGRAYRRVAQRPDGALELAVKSWRLIFRVDGQHVRIERVASGYAPAVVAASCVGTLEDDRAHREFHARWNSDFDASARRDSSE